eukprot:m.80149 g.80149  ORF g.80149 m.80149 type:complete len:134 (+) comp36178_c0_seq2:380-781(+)
MKKNKNQKKAELMVKVGLGIAAVAVAAGGAAAGALCPGGGHIVNGIIGAGLGNMAAGKILDVGNSVLACNPVIGAGLGGNAGRIILGQQQDRDRVGGIGPCNPFSPPSINGHLDPRNWNPHAASSSGSDSDCE